MKRETEILSVDSHLTNIAASVIRHGFSIPASTHCLDTEGGERGRETASEADEAFTQNQESERGGVGGSERASQRESERE